MVQEGKGSTFDQPRSSSCRDPDATASRRRPRPGTWRPLRSRPALTQKVEVFSSHHDPPPSHPGHPPSRRRRARRRSTSAPAPTNSSSPWPKPASPTPAGKTPSPGPRLTSCPLSSPSPTPAVPMPFAPSRPQTPTPSPGSPSPNSPANSNSPSSPSMARTPWPSTASRRNPSSAPARAPAPQSSGRCSPPQKHLPPLARNPPSLCIAWSAISRHAKFRSNPHHSKLPSAHGQPATNYTKAYVSPAVRLASLCLPRVPSAFRSLFHGPAGHIAKPSADTASNAQLPDRPDTDTGLP